MVSDRRAIHPCAIGVELLLGGNQRRLRRFQSIARVLQLFRGHRPGASKKLPASEILLRCGQIRVAHLHCRLQLRGSCKQIAHLTNRLRQLRFRLIQRHLRVLLIQPHQGLAGFDELGIVGTDCDHGTRDLRSYLHDVATDVSVVCGLQVAQILGPVNAVRRSQKRERSRCDGEQAQAACLERGRFGRRPGSRIGG